MRAANEAITEAANKLTEAGVSVDALCDALVGSAVALIVKLANAGEMTDVDRLHANVLALVRVLDAELAEIRARTKH